MKGKGKGAHEPKAQTVGVYSGFISLKHLGVLLLPPGRDASPSRGYPPQQYVKGGVAILLGASN